MEEWVPPEFKGYNDHMFRIIKYGINLAMLEGCPGAKKWNNIHNTLMHMMLKWDETKLHQHHCPQKPAEEFKKYTPKQQQASTVVVEYHNGRTNRIKLTSGKKCKQCLEHT